MINRIKQILTSLGLIGIIGACNTPPVFYEREGTQIGARIEEGRASEVQFISGCYNVTANFYQRNDTTKGRRDLLNEPSTITIYKRKFNPVTGDPIIPGIDCNSAIPEIEQLVHKMEEYSQPDFVCKFQNREGNWENFPLSSAEQVRPCYKNDLEKTTKCLEQLSPDTKVKCEYK